MRKKYNFPVMIDGEEYWFSRSVAVVCFVFTEDENGKVYILANKRGKGCPDYVGKWNAPCGFLDFNETAAEGAVREVYEECGLHIDPSILVEFNADSDPRSGSGNQSINIRFCCEIDNGLSANLNSDHSEKDEVEEIKWIPVDEIENYEWAFNHKDRIAQMYKNFQVEKTINILRQTLKYKSVAVTVNDGTNCKVYKTIGEQYLSGIKDLIQLAMVDCKMWNYDGHKIFDSEDIPKKPRKY